MTDLSGHVEKLTSDMNLILNFYEELREQILQPSSVTFQTISKFVIAFVRLILAKVVVDGFTGPR